MIADVKKSAEQKMQKSLEALKVDLSKVRRTRSGRFPAGAGRGPRSSGIRRRSPPGLRAGVRVCDRCSWRRCGDGRRNVRRRPTDAPSRAARPLSPGYGRLAPQLRLGNHCLALGRRPQAYGHGAFLRRCGSQDIPARAQPAGAGRLAGLNAPSVVDKVVRLPTFGVYTNSATDQMAAAQHWYFTSRAGMPRSRSELRHSSA